MKSKAKPNDKIALQQSPVDSQITALKSEIATLKASLARAMADYQNLEKRYERESTTVIKFANASLLEKLLEIRDHLGAAATHLQDASLTMIISSLDRLLKEEGVSEIDCAGDFDPARMECQEIVAGDKNKVVSVVRPGYVLHDRILRTARVTVGSGQAAIL